MLIRRGAKTTDILPIYDFPSSTAVVWAAATGCLRATSFILDNFDIDHASRWRCYVRKAGSDEKTS
jgi:hypothetical protein